MFKHRSQFPTSNVINIGLSYLRGLRVFLVIPLNHLEEKLPDPSSNLTFLKSTKRVIEWNFYWNRPPVLVNSEVRKSKNYDMGSTIRSM